MKKNKKVVLMFSGGRDSTISAARLSSSYEEIKLITVISNHLYGLPIVRKRIIELKNILKQNTEWVCVIQPEYKVNDELTWRTCLPCQRAYVAIGSLLAKQWNISNIAFGYTYYQRHFPEQSIYAVSRLKEMLTSHGLKLILPAKNIKTKEEAMKQLKTYNLSHDALEQKCIKQIINVELQEDHLRSEIDRWVDGIKNIIKNKVEFHFSNISQCNIGEIDG